MQAVRLPPGVSFEDYLRFIGDQERASIVPLAKAIDGVAERMDKGLICAGDRLPWPCSHGKVGFRPGELSIWAGYNKHGKTRVLSHAMAVWSQTMPVCQISLEMPMDTLAHYYVRQALARSKASREDVLFALESASYWVYDETDSIESERIMGVVAYVAAELGCRHIVIDSLIKCKVSMRANDSLDAERNFIDRLSWLAKRFSTHIHLVHHMRKPPSGNDGVIPGKYDMRGSGALTDLPDNIVVVWRNKPKEEEAEKVDSGEIASIVDCKHSTESDATIAVYGQRHFEWEGRFGLWFDRESGQFLNDRHGYPSPIVNIKRR